LEGTEEPVWCWVELRRLGLKKQELIQACRNRSYGKGESLGKTRERTGGEKKKTKITCSFHEEATQIWDGRKVRLEKELSFF